MKPFTINAVVIFVLFHLSSIATARNVFLNGTDISSARHSNLEHVNVSIDGQGNIFILAPQYQVNEESTYVPLSSWKAGPTMPKHKAPGHLNNNATKLPEKPAQPLSGGNGLKEKPVPKLPNPDDMDAKEGTKEPPQGQEDQQQEDD